MMKVGKTTSIKQAQQLGNAKEMGEKILEKVNEIGISYDAYPAAGDFFQIEGKGKTQSFYNQLYKRP
jgi:hypothetical protein